MNVIMWMPFVSHLYIPISLIHSCDIFSNYVWYLAIFIPDFLFAKALDNGPRRLKYSPATLKWLVLSYAPESMSPWILQIRQRIAYSWKLVMHKRLRNEHMIYLIACILLMFPLDGLKIATNASTLRFIHETYKKHPSAGTNYSKWNENDKSPWYLFKS